MAMLLLPPELLQTILDLSRPLGYESLMLTSRTLYHAGQKYRDHHNRLKRTYLRFRYYRGPDLDDCAIVSPLQLLHAIGEDPYVLTYLIEADLGHGTHLGKFKNSQYRRLQDRVKHSGSIFRLLEQAELIHRTKQDINHWYDTILEDRNVADSSGYDYSTLLLLMLLNNVTRLKLPSEWSLTSGYSEYDSDIRKLLESIVKSSNEPDRTSATLRELTALEPSISSGYDSIVPLDAIVPFLAIHSVREVYLSSGVLIGEAANKAALLNRYDEIGVNVEHMQLMACCMGAQECGRFFGKMGKLRTLTFSFETKMPGSGHDWEAGDFTAALMTTVGEHLESMSLTVLNCFGSVTPITDLRGFQRLVELELDVRLFLGPPYEDNPLPRRRRQTENYPHSVPHLADILPVSLQSLQILSISSLEYNRCLNDLFKDWIIIKSQKLPQLKQTTIIRGAPMARHHQKEWKRPQVPKNVRLALVNVIDVDVHPQTEAAKEFERRFCIPGY